jgi:uncharacterized membrane protein YeaQ/YmgE (transglycosylase-associated protein family)
MGVIELGARAVLAAACAALGQFLTGYSRGGCPVSFVTAFAGTFIGPWAAERIGWAEPLIVPIGEIEIRLVTSAAGALALVLIVNLVTHKRKF